MAHEMLDLNNRMVVLNDRMIKANKVVTVLTLLYLPASLMSVRSDTPMPQNRNLFSPLNSLFSG